MEVVLLKCIDEKHSETILNEMHYGIYGGHYMSKTIAHKVIRARFLWPTLFKDAHKLVKKCNACQRFSGKLKFSCNLPLKLVEVKAPFQYWGIDFIG